MKRVVSYELRIGEHQEAIDGQADPLRRTPGQAPMQEALINVTLRSWHRAWELALEHLSTTSNPLEAVVLDASNAAIIASFSHVNRQITIVSDDDYDETDVESSERVFPRWESERIGVVGSREFFLNRNTSDYHWLLLEGAKHEVPYRLNFIERVLERYPHGLIAYGVEFIFEIRDRMLPRHSY